MHECVCVCVRVDDMESIILMVSWNWINIPTDGCHTAATDWQRSQVTKYQNFVTVLTYIFLSISLADDVLASLPTFVVLVIFMLKEKNKFS